MAKVRNLLAALVLNKKNGKDQVTIFVIFVHIKSFCQRPCDQTDFMIPNRSLLLSLFCSNTVI